MVEALPTERASTFCHGTPIHCLEHHIHYKKNNAAEAAPCTPHTRSTPPQMASPLPSHAWRNAAETRGRGRARTSPKKAERLQMRYVFAAPKPHQQSASDTTPTHPQDVSRQDRIGCLQESHKPGANHPSTPSPRCCVGKKTSNYCIHNEKSCFHPSVRNAGYCFRPQRQMRKKNPSYSEMVVGASLGIVFGSYATRTIQTSMLRASLPGHADATNHPHSCIQTPRSCNQTPRSCNQAPRSCHAVKLSLQQTALGILVSWAEYGNAIS